MWEVAKKVEVGKIDLGIPLDPWLERALVAPGIRLLDLSPQILVEAARLPGTFHKDPADQVIVATARIRDLELLTTDRAILQYDHVRTIQA